MLTANEAFEALPGPLDRKIRAAAAIARVEDNELPEYSEGTDTRVLKEVLLTGAEETFRGMGNSTIKPQT